MCTFIIPVADLTLCVVLHCAGIISEILAITRICSRGLPGWRNLQCNDDRLGLLQPMAGIVEHGAFGRRKNVHAMFDVFSAGHGKPRAPAVSTALLADISSGGMEFAHHAFQLDQAASKSRRLARLLAKLGDQRDSHPTAFARILNPIG